MKAVSEMLVADIVRRIRAQEVLEEEDFSGLIIRSTIDGIYAYDLDHVVTLWNPAMERITGMKKEQVLGRDIFDTFPFFKKFDLEYLILDPLQGKQVPEREIPFEILQTGKRGYARRLASPLRDETGAVVGGINIVHEITDRKEAEDEIAVRRHAEERLKFLSDAGMLLSGTLDYELLLKRIINLVTRHFKAWTKLRLIQDDESIRVITGHEDPDLSNRLSELERLYPPPEDLREGPYHILRNGGHHFVPRFTKEMLDAFAKSPEHRRLLEPLSGYVCVPLQAGGRIFGTLSLLGTAREFTEEDLSLSQDLARWVALALDNARLYALARRRGK